MDAEVKQFIEQQTVLNRTFKEHISGLQADLKPLIDAQLVDRMNRAENSLKEAHARLDEFSGRIEKLEELTQKLSQLSVQDILDDKAFKAALGVVANSVTTERERIDALTRFLGCIPVIKDASPNGVLPGSEPCEPKDPLD